MSKSLITAYLLAYNVTLLGGWCAVFVKLADFAFKNVEDPFGNSHSNVGQMVIWLQSLAVLEIVHAATGMVKGSASSAVMQVGGRNIVLYIIHSVADIHGYWAVGLLYLMWAVAEMVRYPFYATSLVNACPAALTWLRYSAFVPLYPVGFFAEVMCMVAALPYVEAFGMLSLAMPNTHNIAFHLPTALYVYMACAYIGGAPSLYKYMLAQRRKTLGGQKQQQARKDQ